MFLSFGIYYHGKGNCLSGKGTNGLTGLYRSHLDTGNYTKDHSFKIPGLIFSYIFFRDFRQFFDPHFLQAFF